VKWLWNYALARAREPSTWRGLVMLIAGSWAVTHREQAEAIIAVGVTLAGAIGVFVADDPDVPIPTPPGGVCDTAGADNPEHMQPIPGRARADVETNPPGPFGF